MSIQKTECARFDRACLKESFSKVPVGLKLLGGPINPRSPSIFQMNIHHSRQFGEYVQIWPGDRRNEIEVLSIDRSLVQLVLRVKEPRRPYVEVVKKTAFVSASSVAERVHAAGGRILRETHYDWRVELWTPEFDRRYLCGMDDLHLFIAQIQMGDTVAQAHESLKPELVRQREAALPRSIQRQGEWFFVPLSEEESQRLDEHLNVWSGAVKKRAPVGAGERPHVADVVVTIDRRVRSKRREYRRPEVYARGLVVHPDHRNLQLSEWRRVVRNAEIRTTNDQLRLSWID
jgi:hypothetical protein